MPLPRFDYGGSDALQQLHRLGSLPRPSSLVEPPSSGLLSPKDSNINKTGSSSETDDNVRKVLRGLAKDDWHTALSGWTALHRDGQKQRELDFQHSEAMVRLLMQLDDAVLARDWDDIKSSILVPVAMREVELQSHSIIAQWIMKSLRSNLSASALERIFSFWNAFITECGRLRPRTDASRYRVELSNDLFASILAAHFLAGQAGQAHPLGALLQFIRTLMPYFAVPEKYHDKASYEYILPLIANQKGSSDEQRERLSWWCSQMRLVQIWLRAGQAGLKTACARWRERRNSAAAHDMWRLCREALAPLNPADAWMTIDWTEREANVLAQSDALSPTVHNTSTASRSRYETNSSSNFALPEGVSIDLPNAKLPANFTPALAGEFLHTFIHNGANQDADSVFQFLQSLGLKPPVITWTGLLHGLSQQRNPDAVRQTFDKMQETGVEPDSVCWSILVNTYFRANRYDEGLQCAQALLADRKFNQNDRTQLPVRFFNVVINGLLWNDSPEVAMTFLRSMGEYGVAPDIYTVNILLRYYSRPKTHNLKGLSATIKLIEELKLVPDVVSFTTVLDALLRAGASNAVESVHAIMESFGVQPNVVTFGTMIDFLVKKSHNEGDPAGLHAAIKLFRDMQNSTSRSPQPTHARPTEVTYTTLVQGLANFAVLRHTPQYLQLAEELHTEMQNAKVPSNRIAYSALMCAHISFDNFDEAMRYFNAYRALKRRRQTFSVNGVELVDNGADSMVSVTERVPLRVWQALLEGLVSKGQMRHAQQVLTEMAAVGLVPGPSGSLRRLADNVERALQHVPSP